MLIVEQLTKRSRKRLILSDINLTCDFGESVGIFGDQESGKKELLQCLANVTNFQAGKLSWQQESEMQLKPLVYMMDTIQIIPGYTATSYGTFLKDVNPFFDMEEYQALLQQFKVPVHKNIKYLREDLQRLCEWAVAFSQQALFYVLEEPFNYLDDAQQNMILEVMEIKARQSIVIIASVYETQWLPHVSKAIYLQAGKQCEKALFEDSKKECETITENVVEKQMTSVSSFSTDTFYVESGDDDETY